MRVPIFQEGTLTLLSTKEIMPRFLRKYLLISLSLLLPILYLTDSKVKHQSLSYIERKQAALKNLMQTPSNRLPLNEIAHRIQEGCPAWMSAQIEDDLCYYKDKPIPVSKIESLFESKGPDLSLVKFSISQNKIHVESPTSLSTGSKYRMNSFLEALTQLSSIAPLRDTVFLLSLEDSLSIEEDVPLFLMSKLKSAKKFILIPDFEALRAKYQVLKGRDITSFEYPWQKKIPQLVWRGSTAQTALDFSTNKIREDNLHLFSRITLCELSQKFPELINAKFTLFVQGGELIPSLRSFHGNWIDYVEQLKYKYHLLIDGNASSYTASGWRFFSNALVFIPDTEWTQWYYSALKPGIHFIPVKKDLEDLVEKITWAVTHDTRAEEIAHNARLFALDHLTIESHLVYLYFLLEQYSQLVGNRIYYPL